MGEYSLIASTGAVGAALGQNSAVFVMRSDPAGNTVALIRHIELDWSVSTAFTAPVTAGRRVSFYRGAGAAASGGTALATMGKENPDSLASQFDAAEGGDARVASTGALTVTGITFEATEIDTMFVAGFGAATSFKHEEYDFDQIVLKSGQCLAIRNPVAMDAAGVWNLGIAVDWEEVS